MKKKNIFESVVPEDKLHERFIGLRDQKGYSSAKKLVESIYNSFEDIDGNFIEQFQTTGFKARLWEIFLFKYLTESGGQILRKHDRPDFQVVTKLCEFYVEAVTSNPTHNNQVIEDIIKEMEVTEDAQLMAKHSKSLVEQYIIKIGSALYSKLNEKPYWELEWVQGKPLVLAVYSVHHKFAPFFPDYNIISYLYGKESVTSISETGAKVHKLIDIEKHLFEIGDKTIPSGFFKLPNSENISAVIFTNNCDENKFLRMGMENEFQNEAVLVVRSGKKNNPNSDIAEDFTYVINDGTHKENWMEGVNVFHNPNAKFPLLKESLPGSRHMWIENGQLYEIMPQFYPFNSLTLAILIPVA